ncbi:MAG: putative manganese-dependent inorganic diphosphatase [Solirubrobacteraceae bacterium]
MPLIYVTGHRNPDTDSIASSIAYAELNRRLDPRNDYVPVRLGELNTQTRWVLQRSGAPEPALLPHIMLRACDVMQTDFPRIDQDAPVRTAGIEMAHANVDVVAVLDERGALIGVVTTRTLARRYSRESRAGSSLYDAPTYVHAVVDVLEGQLVIGKDKQLSGRVWVHSMDVSSPTGIAAGDVVVLGNRVDAQRLSIEKGAALVVISNSASPSEEILALAREHDTAIIVSPLDTYVTGRMITLAAPCRALMDEDPLTAMTDDLLADVSEQIKDIHYGAAVVVDSKRRPVGLVTRSDLVAPARRRVLLVDHAERAQSVIGVEQAEIVEILDHHHIGSIETRVPVRATFDPVGSTSTLVVERFRQSGLEPSRQAAVMLMAAIMSDTVILNSPTTTDRDYAVIEYLERALAMDAREFGREMFETTADVSAVSVEEIVARDAKDYQVGAGFGICIAQIEVVGRSLLERKEELLAAMTQQRSQRSLHSYALMITDVLSKGTVLLVSGDSGAIARAFGVEPTGDAIELPGVMSRKKQVAPKLLSAF